MKPTEPSDAGQSPQDGTPRRQPLTQRTYYTLLDQRIAAAQADGKFDNLPGAGKPFQFDDDSLVPEEDRVGYRMLKNAGFAPSWIEMRETIRSEQTKLETWRANVNSRWNRTGSADRQKLLDEYHHRIGTLNRQILHYNLSVPRAVGQLPTLVLKDELLRLGDPN